MQHVELHVINNEAEAAITEEIGLITFTVDEFCENCKESVAFVDDGAFIPCVLVLADVDGEDVEYFVCSDCAAPVLDPDNF
jgi:molybdenum cofactor biosynthesis enzyme MoaA